MGWPFETLKLVRSSRILSAVVCTFCTASVFLAAAVPAPAQPNFITIQADDLSLLEFKREVMPNVYRYLVDRGTSFPNYHVNHPICGPSMASLHTGQYAHNHGMKWCRDTPAFSNQDTLSDYVENGSLAREGGKRFHDAGWYSAMIGKWSQNYGNTFYMARLGKPIGFVPDGWDDWYVTMQPTYHFWNVSNRGRIQTQTGRFITDALASRAIATIDAAKAASKPLFMNFWLPNPQKSWALDEKSFPSRVSTAFGSSTVPAEGDFLAPAVGKHPGLQGLDCSPTSETMEVLQENYRERLRSMKAADQALGRIFRHLEAAGDLNNTIVVFTSDNGFKLGHWCLSGKVSPYYRDVNVPFVIAGPGITKGSRDEVITTIDVLPTLMALGGLTADPIIDGQSFAHFFSGGTCWRRWAFVESCSMSWLTLGDDTPFTTDASYLAWHHRSLKSRGEKFISWRDGHQEFYTDQLDLVNTVGTLDASTKAQHDALILQRASCAGTSCHQWDIGVCSQ